VLRTDSKKLNILLDSKTFDNLLKNDNRLAIAILEHYDSRLLEFIRTPFDSAYKELKRIDTFQLMRRDSEIESIEIHSAKENAQMHFGYGMNDIKTVSKEIYSRDPLDDEELDRIVLIFVQKVFNELHRSDVYITNDKVILGKRGWFEEHFPGGPLNIVSVDEASMFIDYYFKNNDYYFLNPHMRLRGTWYWYWLSTRLKLPHYNVGDPMLDAMSYRFSYCLMALDEIAVQFYEGPNNDTLNRTLYHFDHLIALATGIFDNLAMKTDSLLGINTQNLTRISLSNISGADFLKEVKSKDPTLREHISDYMIFIMLIYSFRDLVIHREGLAKTLFEYRGEDARWRANVVKLSEKQVTRLEECRRWGIPSLWGAFMNFLEPYQFSQMSLKVLMIFVDKYLELLGQPSFIDGQKMKKEDPFTRDLVDFEKYHLGF